MWHMIFRILSWYNWKVWFSKTQGCDLAKATAWESLLRRHEKAILRWAHLQPRATTLSQCSSSKRYWCQETQHSMNFCLRWMIIFIQHCVLFLHTVKVKGLWCDFLWGTPWYSLYGQIHLKHYDWNYMKLSMWDMRVRQFWVNYPFKIMLLW